MNKKPEARHYTVMNQRDGKNRKTPHFEDERDSQNRRRSEGSEGKRPGPLTELNRPTGKTVEDYRTKKSSDEQLDDALRHLASKKKSRGGSTLSNGSHIS